MHSNLGTHPLTTVTAYHRLLRGTDAVISVTLPRRFPPTLDVPRALRVHVYARAQHKRGKKWKTGLLESARSAKLLFVFAPYVTLERGII